MNVQPLGITRKNRKRLRRQVPHQITVAQCVAKLNADRTFSATSVADVYNGCVRVKAKPSEYRLTIEPTR